MGKREKSEMLPVCRKIAAGSLLEHKFQSACVIAAVMLTTVLFTTVFASVFYFQSSIRQAQMENAAWTAHGAVIGVSEEQIRAMAQDSRVSDASCYPHLGFLKDDAADEVIEMQYCEDKLASWMFYEPVWGHMPAGGMEAVVSTQLLESWGIAPKGRETIRLSYMVNGILKEADFTICGAYEQKPSSAEVMFVSQEFCRRELAEASGDENRDSMLGVRVAEVMFQSDARLQRSMEQLMEQIGAQENDWMLNPAFADSAGMDTGVAAALAGVLAVIMLCGYFIIYNIYNISVMQDTRFYGSLAVMGFLKTEILGIVHAKTNMLCAIAIPLGFLPGVGLAMVFLPKIMASFGFLSVKAVPHPLIFLFSALFSYITVRISSRRPARIAAGMEPVLARRFVRAGAGRTKASKSKNGCRMHVMAWKHMMRDRRKSLMICGSLVMCVMLSALFYTISKGMNLEVFLKDMITSDFIIADRSYFNQAQGGHDFAGHGDVESVFALDAVGLRPKADVHLSQLAVIHVQTPAERDPVRIDAQFVALVDVVVNDRRQQVVGCGDRMHVPREVQVDVLHRHDLRIAAACSSALESEHRSKTWLPHGHHGVFSQQVQRISQADGGSGLAFTGFCRVDGRDQDQFAIGGIQGIEIFLGELRLGPAIGLQGIGRNPRLCRHFVNGVQYARLCDFEICQCHYAMSFLPMSVR